MNFSEKLVTLRKNAGMSQDTLAIQLGISRQAVSKWEQGTAMPETENIIRLAQIFDVSTDYLLDYLAVRYPDVKGQVKKHKEKIMLAMYISVTASFLFCCMKAVVHLAREIIWTVRPLAYITVDEWKKIAWGLGLDNLHYAVLFLALAVVLYIIKTVIRKLYGGRQK